MSNCIAIWTSEIMSPFTSVSRNLIEFKWECNNLKYECEYKFEYEFDFEYKRVHKYHREDEFLGKSE